MRIGLYGGTFDPIHLGHLRAAETAREGAGLDAVAFLPSAVPPHRGAALSAAADRLAMARLATASQPRFESWDAELRRPGPSYTVETVERLLADRPSDTLVLVVGADTWPEMTSWREPERLFSLVEVVVVDRPGYPAPGPTAPPFPGARGVRRVDGPTLPISATAIRERARQGLSVRFLVPDPVADFITERRLYR
ncbi:MAG TPA: nicotinate-nucleotide adenylyltransferase [Vicinamibacteria bacterium]|nr:nicotinate-nucleotide adenylyltransferase [Vicinamibacteria bacterium]